MWVIPGVIESRTCLLPMVTEESVELLRLYPHFERGVMPFAGGLLDQPNGFVQAMDVIRVGISNASNR